MKKTERTGWYTVAGYEVYIENGIVKRGIGADPNGSRITVYPYIRSKYGYWDKDTSLTEAAFRARVARGTLIMS